MARAVGLAPRWRTFAAMILLPWHLAACTTWRVQPVSPQDLIATEQPGRVRVTLADGHQRTIHWPRIANDSVVGRNAWNSRTAVSLAEIRQVAVKRFDGTQTAIAVGLTALFVAIIAVAVSDALGGMYSGGTICCTDW